MQDNYPQAVMNPEGVTIKANRAWKKLWRVKIEDLEGYNILQDRQLEQLNIIQYIRKEFSCEEAFIHAAEYNVQKTLGKGTLHIPKAPLGIPEAIKRRTLYKDKCGLNQQRSDTSYPVAITATTAISMEKKNIKPNALRNFMSCLLSDK